MPTHEAWDSLTPIHVGPNSILNPHRALFSDYTNHSVENSLRIPHTAALSGRPTHEAWTSLTPTHEGANSLLNPHLSLLSDLPTHEAGDSSTPIHYGVVSDRDPHLASISDIPVHEQGFSNLVIHTPRDSSQIIHDVAISSLLMHDPVVSDRVTHDTPLSDIVVHEPDFSNLAIHLPLGSSQETHDVVLSAQSMHLPEISNQPIHLPDISSIIDVDVEIVSMDLVGPAEVMVGEPAQITVVTEVVVNSVYWDVDSFFDISYQVDLATPELEVTPLPQTKQVQLLNGEPQIVQAVFDIVCLEPSFHDIDFTSTITPVDPHVHDINLDNNSRSASITVASIAEVDVEILSMELVGPEEVIIGEPAQITVVEEVVVNSADWDVDSFFNVSYRLDFTTPGCEVTPLLQTQQVQLLNGTPQIVEAVFDVLCLDPSFLTFTFDFTSTITPVDPHVHDINPDNNSRSASITMDAKAEIDVEILSMELVGPEEVIIGEPAQITVVTEVVANGQGWYVDSFFDVSYWVDFTTPGLNVTPLLQNQQVHLLNGEPQIVGPNRHHHTRGPTPARHRPGQQLALRFHHGGLCSGG